MSTQSRKVLVTGAAGNLGRAVCAELEKRGHSVRGTDKKLSAEAGSDFVPGDLLDEFFARRALAGCDALVHLGNHPNRFAGPSDQRLLAENTAMNANIFLSAIDQGIECLVFASSIQAMLRAAGGRQPPPFPIPYLPIDGEAPADPGLNTYALSKVFAELLLRTQCERRGNLSATALRFPMLPLPWAVKSFTDPGGIPRERLNLAECLAHLTLSDAACAIAEALEHALPGYHQYLPAVSTQIEGMDTARLVAEFYPEVPLRKPAKEFDSLIDISALQTELGWAPRERMRIRLRAE